MLEQDGKMFGWNGMDGLDWDGDRIELKGRVDRVSEDLDRRRCYLVNAKLSVLGAC